MDRDWIPPVPTGNINMSFEQESVVKLPPEHIDQMHHQNRIPITLLEVPLIAIPDSHIKLVFFLNQSRIQINTSGGT